MGDVAQQSQRSNFYHLIMDIAWFGLALPAIARFLSIYAIRLGATEQELAWIASAPALVLFLSVMPSRWWQARHSDSARAVILPSLGYRFTFLLPALTPLMPSEWQVAWLILSVTIPAIPQGVASVVFLVMLREAVDQDNLMRLIARRALTLNITLAVGGLAFGFWLEYAPFPLNYQMMYLLAFVLVMVSLAHVKRTRVLFNEREITVNAEIVADTPSVPVDSIPSPFRSLGFQRVAVSAVLTHIAFFSTVPFLPLFLYEVWDATEGFIAIFALFELIGGAMFAPLLPMLSKQLGNRWLVGLAMVGTSAAILIVAAAPMLEFTLISAFVGGASWTLVGNALFGYFSENTPSEALTRYTTAYHQVIFLAIFIGPLMGSWFLGQGISLLTVLIISGFLRFGAGLLTVVDPLPVLRTFFGYAWITRRARV